MALEATHIRFALDVKEKYQVRDVKKYIAGTLYPDSRYKTEIIREVTHPKDFMEWDMLNIDDFQKGWFIHLWVDGMQGQIMREKFPDFFKEKIEYGNQAWINITAIKVLQDFDDLKKFDLKSNLPSLDAVEARNGEDKKLIVDFYTAVRETYAEPEKLSLEDYIKSAPVFGLTKEIVSKVVIQAKEFLKDENTKNSIIDIYPEMLIRMS